MGLLGVSEKPGTHRFLNILFRKLGLKIYVYFIVEAKDNLTVVILSARTEISEISVKIWKEEGTKTGYCLTKLFWLTCYM